MERDFKGIWIPKEIWLDTRLAAHDKIILAEICSLSTEEGCYASNEYLAEFCQCSVRKVSEAIRKLMNCGYVELQSFDGRKRILRGRLANSARQTSKICEADWQNLRGSYTIVENNNLGIVDSNIVENNNTPIVPTGDCTLFEKNGDNTKNTCNSYDTLFNQFWEAYPRKDNKANSKKAFVKLKPTQETVDWMLYAIGKAKRSEQWCKDGGQYIPMPSTWLNGRRWEDYTPEPKPIEEVSNEPPMTSDEYEAYLRKLCQKDIEYRKSIEWKR